MEDSEIKSYDFNTIAHFRGVLLTERVKTMAQAERNGQPALVEDLNSAERNDRPQVMARHNAEEVKNKEQLRDIELALSKCDDGTYGSCVDCHKPILLARLEAVPIASRCVLCQKKHGSQNSLHEVKTNQVSGYNPMRIFAKRSG